MSSHYLVKCKIYDKMYYFSNFDNLNKSSATAMKQTLGRQAGEVREHESNMHVCVGVG